MAKRQYLEFVSSGIETNSAMEASKKSSMYDLRTGKPFNIPEEDQYGRCRPVTDFEKLNRIGEGTYGIVYRARDTTSGKLEVINDYIFKFIFLTPDIIYWYPSLMYYCYIR